MLVDMAIAIEQFRADTWERLERAVERVRERLKRATRALRDANVPYAVIGGHAVAAWVTQVDPGGGRNTRDVDIAIRREDFDRTKLALEAVGFEYHNIWDVDCFIDGPDGLPSEAVHLIFAREKVRPLDSVPFPDVVPSRVLGGADVLSLESLVTAKLTSFRRKDQTHLDDLMRYGLIDATWLDRLPPALAERLKHLIDNPE